MTRKQTELQVAINNCFDIFAKIRDYANNQDNVNLDLEIKKMRQELQNVPYGIYVTFYDIMLILKNLKNEDNSGYDGYHGYDNYIEQLNNKNNLKNN